MAVTELAAGDKEHLVGDDGEQVLGDIDPSWYLWLEESAGGVECVRRACPPPGAGGYGCVMAVDVLKEIETQAEKVVMRMPAVPVQTVGAPMRVRR